jgi:hypothetical protein
MPAFQLYFETMAGTHLEDSVRALRDAGSPDALYEPSLRATPDAACSSSERSAQLAPLAASSSALVPSASSTTPLDRIALTGTRSSDTLS